MPKKINPELKGRAVRMVQEHQQDYPSVAAASRTCSSALSRRGDCPPILGRGSAGDRPQPPDP